MSLPVQESLYRTAATMQENLYSRRGIGIIRDELLPAHVEVFSVIPN